MQTPHTKAYPLKGRTFMSVEQIWKRHDRRWSAVPLVSLLFLVGHAAPVQAQTCATSCASLRTLVSSYCAARGATLDANRFSCATDAQGNGGGGGACRSPKGTTVGSYGGSVYPVCPRCGNGVIEANESCDDGNTVAGDGCSATCASEPPVCGNRSLESGEQCDDGNLVAGDGCSSSCRREPTTDVGVLKGTNGCPNVSKEEVWIHIDNEDSGSADSETKGWTGVTARVSYGNLKYQFCRLPGSHFAGRPGRFAVLSLGDTCPAGSLVYKRRFDTEDDDPANHYSGNITPNVVAGNALFVFCVFPGNAATIDLPRFGVEYGVFGTAEGSTNYIFSDDENGNIGNFGNINYYEGPNAVQTRESAYPEIMEGESDTWLYVIRVPE